MTFKTGAEAVVQTSNRNWGSSCLQDSCSLGVFTPRDGENKVRFLPPHPEDKNATFGGLPVWKYYVNGVTYLAPGTFTSPVKDPLLTRYTKFKLADPERAAIFKPSAASIAFVLDFSEANPEIRLWMAPATMLKRILNKSRLGLSCALIALDDPEDGRVVMFDRTGSGVGTRYENERVADEPSPVGDVLLGDIPRYEDILKVLSPDELEEIAQQAEANRDIKAEADPDGEAPPEVRVVKTEQVEDPSKKEAMDKVRAKLQASKEKF